MQNYKQEFEDMPESVRESAVDFYHRNNYQGAIEYRRQEDDLISLYNHSTNYIYAICKQLSRPKLYSGFL